MKFEKIGDSYYVNSQMIRKNTFKAIFNEIWGDEDYSKVLSTISSGGVATIVFNGNYLDDVNKLKADLQAERKKNQLLTAKLAAVESAFLNLQTA